MVTYHRPIPERNPRGKAGNGPASEQAEEENAGGSGILGAWVQAEKFMQIALMLPCAAFIGWLIGYGLDRWLHQTWIAMIGVVVGIIAGLVGAIRMAMVYAADPTMEDKNGNGSEGGNSGDPS